MAETKINSSQDSDDEDDGYGKEKKKGEEIERKERLQKIDEELKSIKNRLEYLQQKAIEIFNELYKGLEIGAKKMELKR